jgi:protein-S-isoprenylcysteine O-methyltransferase Ste14
MLEAHVWFKVAFIVTFIAAVTVVTSTARRATRHHGEALNQLPHEVRGLIVARALLGLVFYASLVAWLFWPASLSWCYLPVPTALRWLAVGLLVPVLLFFTWSVQTLGTSYRGGVGLYTDHALVVTGPYAHMRHPIYVAFIAIMVLVLVLSANWVLGLSGLLLVGSIAMVRIPIEEAELRERFGASWDAYCHRVGRIFVRR